MCAGRTTRSPHFTQLITPGGVAVPSALPLSDPGCYRPHVAGGGHARVPPVPGSISSENRSSLVSTSEALQTPE